MKCSNIVTSVYLTFPFLMAIFLSIRTVFLFHMQQKENNPQEINWKHQALILVILIFLSESIIGSSYFCLSKSKHQREITNVLVLQKYRVDAVKYSSFRKSIQLFFWLLLATLLDFTNMLGSLYVPSFLGEASQTTFALKSLQIISTGILCYFLFHFLLYRHQYIAITLVIIGITLVTWNNISNEIKSIGHVLLLVFMILIISFQQVTDRWIMDEKNLLPFQLLFLKGLIGLVTCAILYIILSFIECKAVLVVCEEGKTVEDLPGLLNKINKDWIIPLFLVVWTICSGWFNLFSLYSTFYLTPTHKSIADTLSTFALWSYMRINGIQNEKKYGYITTIIGYIILIFGCLFYNEIITVRFCQLNYYTKKEISIRAKKEIYIEYSQLLDVSDACD